jgi:hypothetical protein
VVLSSKNSGNTLKYQWKKNNVNISGATNKNFTATTAGDYKVKVTDTLNNCYKTSGIKTITVPCRGTGEALTEQLENSYELIVAPNPLSNAAIISFSLSQSEIVSLKIFDLDGRLIKILADMNFEEGDHQIEWNANDNLAGVYILNIQTSSRSENKKIIIAK